jgi:curved DNA-binding protein CbpA
VCVILNEAYETLMDEDTREVYDRDLAELRYAESMATGEQNEFQPYTVGLCTPNQVDP